MAIRYDARAGRARGDEGGAPAAPQNRAKAMSLMRARLYDMQQAAADKERSADRARWSVPATGRTIHLTIFRRGG